MQAQSDRAGVGAGVLPRCKLEEDGTSANTPHQGTREATPGPETSRHSSGQTALWAHGSGREGFRTFIR